MHLTTPTPDLHFPPKISPRWSNLENLTLAYQNEIMPTNSDRSSTGMSAYKRVAAVRPRSKGYQYNLQQSAVLAPQTSV